MHGPLKVKFTNSPLLSHDDIFKGIAGEICTSEKQTFGKINLR